jgi:hypothetical protein
MNREGEAVSRSRHRVIGKAKPLTTKDTHTTPLSQAQGRSGQAAEHKGKDEPYANCMVISETHANLCPSTRKTRVDGARLG